MEHGTLIQQQQHEATTHTTHARQCPPTSCHHLQPTHSRAAALLSSHPRGKPLRSPDHSLTSVLLAHTVQRATQSATSTRPVNFVSVSSSQLGAPVATGAGLKGVYAQLRRFAEKVGDNELAALTYR